MLRLLLAFVAASAFAQTPPPPPPVAPPPAGSDVTWPREAKGADGTVITVYQPQIESWADNRLTGRAAVAVKRPGEQEPSYGVIELAAQTQIDKASDVATLTGLRVTKSSFPGASEQDAKRYLDTLRGAVRRDSWPVSVQALQSNLAITQARSKQKAQPVKNDPPQILFRTVPSMLVLVDGEPALRPVKEAPSLERVINTAALILHDKPGSAYYLYALSRWWAGKTLTGDWEPAVVPPSALEQTRAALDKQYNPMDGKDADGKPLFDPAITPRIIVATKPTELLQSKGEPQMSPIPGTQLLYMANSPNDILFDLVGQAYYALISGRWFSAKTMNGPWSYAGKSLPPDFAKIPPDHAMGDLLAAVPGTPQAREATIANEIPQTATVQRSVQPTPVNFDGGEPQWKPIDGTSLSYAPNTQSPVIRVDAKAYYVVQNGVWFVATAPAGPWTVATAVPAVIYSIPPSSPMHYVTYVRVYSSTPTTVFVGYTPGYYGTVTTTDGVVVYGTGYYYPAYVGTYWYPYPPTYGYGVGFSVGFFWGFAVAGGGWYRPCCYGGGGVYVSHRNTNINIDNSYGRWGDRAQAQPRPATRDVQSRQVGNTTVAKGANNNVYAGRDGQVYRKDQGGDWQKYDGRGQGWSDVGGDRGQPRASNQLPGETRGSLDRQAQARDMGNSRAQATRGGGGYGGGGFSGGGRGMGGGGGRGGGRR